jgi:hypothetical protein
MSQLIGSDEGEAKMVYVLMPIETQRNADEDREYFALLRNATQDQAGKLYAAASEQSAEHKAAHRVRLRDMLAMESVELFCVELIGNKLHRAMITAKAWRDGMYLVPSHIYQRGEQWQRVEEAPLDNKYKTHWLRKAKS